MDSKEKQIKQFSFVESELDILKFWDKEKIFKKSLDKNSQANPYIFYDGPPFATGLPHHGHLVGSTLKDIIPRYFTMKGCYVERRFGWDCHGLPIEYEIDKKLGMSAQDAVLKLGVGEYNNQCRSIVSKYTNEWIKTITRIGRWVDFDNDYKTMDTDFMESVWNVFKQLWDKGLIYHSTKIMPISTDLETVLSNFEASENYQDVQDPAITVLFKLLDEEAYFAAWTTTPWTLPSNLALCAGSEIDYCKVLDKESNKNIYMAQAAVEEFSKKKEIEIISKMKGSDLLGKKYIPLFSYFEDQKDIGAFQLLNDDYVTTDTGTGIVHISPGFGEDDNRVIASAGLKGVFACPVKNNGTFTSEVSDYVGRYVKDCDKDIILDLKNRNILYKQSTIVHSYPFCYRSDTPLIYKAIPSWFVNVTKVKENLIKVNKDINWVPSHIKEGRFGKWLDGARDWAISRNRIWGTPLPIWKNEDTNNYICIGSIEELKKYTGVLVNDLHKDHVDHLEFSIAKEEGIYKRIPEVLDCWFESGSMPYAQLHYPFDNKETFSKGFPAEFIAEGLDQTRGWFYTLNVISTALFNKPAFKNVIVNGLVMSKNGKKKLSKRLKNYTAPDLLMEEHGADAFRLYLINSGLVKGEQLKFDDDGVKDMVRRALLPWYNSFKFFSTYARLDNFDFNKDFVKSENITDNWILSNLQTLKKSISSEMEAYRLYNVVPALFNFIEDLTNWYIRLNRGRFWGEGLDQDKKAAYSTLFTCIKEVSMAMAPFAPFTSDYIYKELSKFESISNLPISVHLCDYPMPQSDLINPLLEEAVNRIQQIILLGRQKRNDVKIKVKTPLQSMTVIHKDQTLLDEIKKLENYLKTELNVKNIIYSTNEEKYISLYAKPNLPVLGKRLGKEMGKFMKAISNISSADITEMESKGRITVLNKVFTLADFLIFREAKSGTKTLSNRYISVELDTTLNDNLIKEGLAREVVSRIQKLRKESGFNVEDRVNIEYFTEGNLKDSIANHYDYIKKETLVNDLSFKDISKNGIKFDIENNILFMKIYK